MVRTPFRPLFGTLKDPVSSHSSNNPEVGDASSVSGDDETERVVADLVQRQMIEARDGANLARLADLESKVTEAIRASRAEATLKAYRSDWADFTIWCETIGATSLPASPSTVAAYLADLASPPDDRKPLATATIRRRKSSIGEAHKLAGHVNPCLDPLVKQVSKGVRRQLGVAAKNRKAGLSTADVKAMLAELDDTRLIDVS